MLNLSTALQTRFWLGLVAALALVAGACGNTTEESADEVATLETDDGAALEEAADAAVITEETPADLEPEEAALAFSQCMRDEGVDIPDLSVDANGNIELRTAFESVDRTAEGFRDATQECRPLLAAGGFGGRREALQSPEVQDGLVAFSDCLRDEGLDVGDLTLGGPGGGPGAGAGQNQNQGQNQDQADGPDGGDGEGPQEGRRQGGFGDRNTRIAGALGLDPEAPEVEAALETCGPVLDEAFSAAGIGQPPANG